MSRTSVEHQENIGLRAPPGLPVAIPGIDVVGLVYLIGELVNPADPVECRRRTLLDALGEWIGADAWFWLRRKDTASAWQRGLNPGMWRRFRDGFPGASRSAAIEVEPRDLAMGHALLRSSEGREPTAAAFLRRPDRPPFSPRETRLAMVLLEEVPWLYLDDPEDTLAAVFARLSPRQTVIAGLLAQGLDRKDIAARLDITPQTLATHIKGIYRRLGIRSQAALIQSRGRNGGPDEEAGPPAGTEA